MNRHPSLVLAALLAATTLLAPPANAAPPRVLHVAADIAVSTDWSLADADVYVLDTTVTVLAGATLRIRPGVVVKAADDARLGVQGVLDAEGATLTSARDDSVGGDTDGAGGAPAPSVWGGVWMTGVGSATFFDVALRFGGINAVVDPEVGPLVFADGSITESIEGIEYSGTSLRVSGSQVQGGVSGVAFDTVEVVDNTVTDERISVVGGTDLAVQGNTVSGVRGAVAAFEVGSPQLRPSALSGNVAVDNDVNAIGLSGVVQEDWTLTGEELLPVMIGSSFSGLRIPTGRTLTLEPGLVLKPTSYAGYPPLAPRLTIDGTLAAVGTANEPIVLTSQRDDGVGFDGDGGTAADPEPEDWGGVIVSASGAAAFEHAQIRYASLQAFGALSLTDSELQSSVRGLVADGPGATTVRRSLIDGGLAAHPSAAADQSLAGPITLTDNVVTDGQLLAVAGTDAGVPYSVTGNRVAGPLWDGTEDADLPFAIVLSSPRLKPSAIAGNSAEGTESNLIALNGTLVGNWTVPTTGTGFAITALGSRPGLSVAKNTTLTLPPGVTLKVGPQRASFVVDGRLAVIGTGARPVVVTSVFDDTVGATVSDYVYERPPAAGDWSGIRVGPSGTIAAAGLSLRYTDGTPLSARSTLLSVAKPNCGYLLTAGRATGRCF
ncbi:hypothetical protein HQQ81_21465 [Microbacteriaceae bacterium VKM Ac-2854]|nr:hypothetical protein [Microbacteriaceae bacterium VKM Ac-2854]